MVVEEEIVRKKISHYKSEDSEPNKSKTVMHVIDPQSDFEPSKDSPSSFHWFWQEGRAKSCHNV